MKLILLFILCLFALVLSKPGKKRHTSPMDKKLKNKKEEIKKTKCNHLGEDF
jgi:hypothetical protein